MSLFRKMQSDADEEKTFFMSSVYHADYTIFLKTNNLNNQSFKCRYLDIPADKYFEFDCLEQIFPSPIVFDIAKNSARSNSIDSLKYDFIQNKVTCSHIGGVFFAVIFDFYMRNGFNNELALQEAVKDQLQCVNKSLWERAKNYVGKSLKNDETINLCSVALGKAFSGSRKPKLSIDYYQSAMFDDNTITQIGKQFAVIMANSASETTGRKLGSMIGSAIGSIVPIVGRKIGDTVGGAVGSYGGSKLSSVLSDSFLTSPEEKINMWLKNSIIKTGYEFALSRDEMVDLFTLMDEYLTRNTSLRTSQDVQLRIEEQIKKTSIQITKRRAKVTLPSEKAYLDVLSLLKSK